MTITLPTRRLEGPQFEQDCFPFFSPDSRWLACSAEGAGTLWDLDANELVRGFDLAYQSPLAFSPDSSLIAGYKDGMITIWLRETGGAYSVVNHRLILDDPFELGFDSTGQFLIVGQFQFVGLWDVCANKYAGEYSIPTNEIVLRVKRVNNELVAITLVFDAAYAPCRLCLRDLESEHELRAIPCFDSHPIIADDVNTAIISESNHWCLWDLCSGEEITSAQIRYRDDPVIGFDDTLVVNRRRCDDQAVKHVEFWTSKTRNPELSLEYRYSVAKISCARSQPLIAVIGSNETAFFDTKVGKQLGVTDGHMVIGMQPSSYRFSPNGRWFASGVGQWQCQSSQQADCFVAGEILVTDLALLFDV